MEPGGLIGNRYGQVFFLEDVKKSGYVGHVKAIAAMEPMKALLFILLEEPLFK